MAYTLLDARIQTRRHLNDQTESIWKNSDITAFLNEAIKIIRKTIPEYFTDLVKVNAEDDVIRIDENYEDLLALFAAARCFEQDEQTSRAVQKMNEFEARRQEMDTEIRQSKAYADKVTQAEEDGTYEIEYVKDIYFEKQDSEL